jgi:hypothetical protein
MPNIDSPILDAARRQPLPPMPDTQCKKFEGAKDAAFREDLVTNNGGPQYRGGPIQGGPEPSGKGGPFNKATGADDVGAVLKFKWDVGPNGRPYATDPEVGVAGHTYGAPGKDVGLGFKDGQPPAQPQSNPCAGDPPAQPQSGVKPGVAYGNTKDGTSVYTLDDAKKAGAASAPSDGPKGLNWVDKNQDLKRAIPPPAAPQINDLGPSTNEPEQKTENAAVARNDGARLGDDIAQRI